MERGRLTISFAAAFACLAGLLLAAPAAFAASNIEVVSGNTLTNNSGSPSFTPTGSDSQVGADLINARLQAGNDVTLDTSPDFGQSGTIVVNGSITSANAAGDLTLNGDDVISQGAVSIAVAGNTHVETGVNFDITLTSATNDFTTVSSPDVATLSLRDQNALALGPIDTNSNLEIEAGGNVTQTAGAVLDTNHVSLTVGSNDVTLTNAGNNFDGFIANSVGAATFFNSATGSFQLRGTVSGDLTVTTGGNIFDAEPISVDGTATLDPNGSITLDNPADDFATIAITGATNATLVDTDALTFGPSTMTGNLNVTTGGDVTQTGAIAASTGELALNVGIANDALLTNTSNDFQSLRAVTVNDLNVADTNGLTLGNLPVTGTLTVNTGGPITQAGASSITPTGAATFDANSSSDITLTNASNDFNSLGVTSADVVAVTDASALTLGPSASTISGGFTANTSGSITQTGALAVSGPTVLGAGTGSNITLNNAANDLSSAGIISANDVFLTDANALGLAASTISGGLTTNAIGALTQTGALAVGGATAASGSPVALDQGGNDFTGSVGITSPGGGAAAVDDTNDLTLGSSTAGGSLTATADDDLTVPGSETIASAGALRLVADDSNPAAPAIGAGGITAGANAALTGAGAIRLYGSRRADNSIAGNATFNGSTFTPGTIFVNSPREQWGVYSPAGTATAPFTFFYKNTDDSTPEATITTPANGATYERGEVVTAQYSCSDGGGGSGVTSCSGPVANGSPIDTSTAGEKTFKVDATSGSGGQSTATVNYTVVDPPDPPPPPPPPEPAVEVIGLERDRDAGTATLTIATNLPGAVHIEKTNKVKGFGPVELDEAGNGELEVVARSKAAKKLERTGRVTVNPRIKFAPAGLDYEIGTRHEFQLRQD